MQSNTKTGSTPLPEVAVDDGRIIGLLPVKWRGMIHLRDGHGKEMTKMISVFENGDVYFEEQTKFVRAQTWVKNAVNNRLDNSKIVDGLNGVLRDVEQG